MKLSKLALLLSLMVCFIGQIYANEPYQRYLKAQQMVKQGDWEGVKTLEAELSTYPLKPYLEYFMLIKTFDLNETDKLSAFLKKYPQSPMATWLRRHWLTELKNINAWQRFVDIYKPVNNTKLKCDYLRALQETNQDKKADELISPLWLTGKNMPKMCEQVFVDWLNIREDKKEQLWARFILALKKYNYPLAKRLSQLMSDNQHKAQAILTLYRNPSLIRKTSFVERHPDPEVLSFGLYRLARINPKLAGARYQQLSKQFSFNDAQRTRVLQAIALKYAFRKNTKANDWYRQLIGSKMDPIYEKWLFRAALNHRDWQLIKLHVESLDKEHQATAKNQYWYGRALDQLGDNEKAKAILNQLSHKRDYYGFLASLYLHKKINVHHQPMPLSDDEIAKVKALPGFKRAKIFYQHHQKSKARVELYYLMKHRNEKEKYIISKLVDGWGWHSQSLRLSQKTQHKDDISVRFPVKYKAHVSKHAKKRKLPMALVYAIIRQESQFTPQIRSHAGAIGLMQLMPKTAQITARQYKLKYAGIKSLKEPLTNITFGTAHLNKLHQELNNHPLLVIAAYNAGKNAVNRWRPKNNRAIEADIWVETVPYYETRKYLRHVIANHVVYQHRLGQTPDLNKLMRQIQ